MLDVLSVQHVCSALSPRSRGWYRLLYCRGKYLLRCSGTGLHPLNQGFIYHFLFNVPPSTNNIDMALHEQHSCPAVTYRPFRGWHAGGCDPARKCVCLATLENSAARAAGEVNRHLLCANGNIWYGRQEAREWVPRKIHQHHVGQRDITCS